MFTEKMTNFNGVRLKRIDDGRLLLEQSEKIQKHEMAKTQKDFSSQRALAQYIGVNFRPDVCASV